MANIKFSDLAVNPDTLLETPASGDYVLIYDVSEPLDINKIKVIAYDDLVNLAAQSALQALVSGQATGDIFYASSATALARKAKGTAGQVLRMNSDATAPEWGNGGMSLIEKKLLTSPAASFDFTSIPVTFSHLKIIILGRSDDTGIAYRPLWALFNNDSGNNYDYRYRVSTLNASTMQVLAYQGGDEAYFGVPIPTALATAGKAGSCEIMIPNYSGTTFQKNYHSQHFRETAESDANADMVTGEVDGIWRDTSAIDRITISTIGNFIAGSIASLYGIL